MDSIAVDLYCGLGGWAEGFLAENFTVIGFDIERHDYGTGGYPGQLVLQDVRTLHGAQFKSIADRLRVIVASPPCTEYSYMAMPWTRAKQIARALHKQDEFPAGYRGSRSVEQLNELFNACFRIQREVSAAIGRHIPLIVENVRGAQPWVGRSAWNFGSYHLWGDVPALMPIPVSNRLKGGQTNWRDNGKPGYCAEQLQDHFKIPGFRFDGSGRSFQTESVKTVRHANKRDGHSHTRHLTNQRESDGLKAPGIKLGDVGFNVTAARQVDVSLKPAGFARDEEMKRQHLGFSRKAASAQIAKIPFPLARHIAKCFAGQV